METSPTGLKYQFFVQDEKGIKPHVGDIIFVHMVGKNSKDSAVFDTYKNGGQPFQITIMEPAFKGALEEGFMMMAKGDSAVFKVNADSLYLKTFMSPQLPPYIEKGSEMTFTLKVVDVLTSQQMMEREKSKAMESKAVQDSLLQAYLAVNGSSLSTTASGLKYVIERPNPKGKKPVAGDSVQVHYTGMLLDGTKFDSSLDHGMPYTFPLGKHMVIPGWDEGILLMRTGEKMRLVIPSDLAYGERGAGDRIPPYANLVFEVELIGVK